jgi:hypothetical protein
MFGLIFQPKSLANRKPIPELVIKAETSKQLIPLEVLVAKQDSPQVSISEGVRARAAAAIKIKFKVSYGLSEYLEFLKFATKDELTKEAVKREKNENSASITVWLLSTIIGSAIFCTSETAFLFVNLKSTI